MRIAYTFLLLIVCCVVLFAAKVAVPAPFTMLKAPADPSAWQVNIAGVTPPVLSRGEMGAGVRVAFTRPEKNTVIYLKLQKPIPMPAGVRRVGLWCYSTARFWEDTPGIRFLVRDATGVNYSYAQFGTSLIDGGWSYLECPRFRGGEMGRLDENLVWVDGGLQHHLPIEPVSFVGLALICSSGSWVAQQQALELGPIYADGLQRENSSLYWQTDLGERYLFGDMPFARQPFVLAGDLLKEKGDFTITWQARKALFGQPVAQGQWNLSGYDASLKARFQQLQIPLTAQGQYWLTFTIHGKQSETLRTVATRLKVIRGDAGQPAPISSETRPIGALLVVNPQREEHVYAAGELTRCVIRVWRPEAAFTGALALKVRREVYPKVELGSEESYALTFTGASQYTDIDIALDLSSAPLQRLSLRLLDGARELDRCNQLLGQQETPSTLPWSNRDQVLRFADLFENGNHLFSCAEWDPRYTENTDMAKFEAWVVDVKKQNVNTIELFPNWPDIEPMPGVFWWDQVDARLAIIAKHGLHAMLNLDCTSVPDWLIEESQADEEGMVNGLWGGRNNVLKSPSSLTLKQYYGEYLTHLALRYRKDPNLVAYSSLSIFFDHVWADHPWLGQYVDYSESAKAGFRVYLRDIKGLSLEALARRWGKALPSWESVQLPRTDLFLGLATIDRPDPRPEWRDFLDFRQWSQTNFMTGLVAGTIRKYDDLRPIATHGLMADASWYKQHNMFVCAGSSEGSIDAYRTPFAFPKRAESIAMSFYTPYYTALSMTNLLAQHNLNLQHFWQPAWRWDNCASEDRQSATHALAGWLALFQDELGKAYPVHANDSGPKPVFGMLTSRASILYGIRSFHWPRLYDYKILAERATTVPKKSIEEEVTAQELAALPCVIVDPTARILPMETIKRLVAYVRDGGKLVLAPTSGMYTTDPADGTQVLRRALGLPATTMPWLMTPENKQPGVYTPYYPFEVTGKGIPGEQSLSEPGLTALATPTAGSILAGSHKLVFRVGPYSMYNRDTWGDWSHMLPYFIYGRYKNDRVAGDTVLANWQDGGAAATLHTVGKGQVLRLAGTPDWFNWSDALTELAQWAGPAASTVATTPPPYQVTDGFKGYLLVKDDIRWAVLRNETTGWTGYFSDSQKQKTAPRLPGTIKLRDLPAAKYRVQDITPLLTQGFDQVFTREQLAQQGITVELIPSESRIFRLDPVQ